VNNWNRPEAAVLRSSGPRNLDSEEGRASPSSTESRPGEDPPMGQVRTTDVARSSGTARVRAYEFRGKEDPTCCHMRRAHEGDNTRPTSSPWPWSVWSPIPCTANAGTMDLYAKVNGVPTVIDWKTSKAVYSDLRPSSRTSPTGMQLPSTACRRDSSSGCRSSSMTRPPNPSGSPRPSPSPTSWREARSEERPAGR
jgi:hypothetical protein